MPNPDHIFDQQLIRKIEMHDIRAENMYFDRFLGIERKSKFRAPSDVRTALYVDTVSDIIMYIRNGNGAKIKNLRAYTYTVLSNKYSNWQGGLVRDRTTIDFRDPELVNSSELPDSCLEHEQKEELIRILQEVLDNLTDRCREIFKSKYIDRQRFGDIAVSLGYASANAARGAHHMCITRARELGGDYIDRLFE